MDFIYFGPAIGKATIKDWDIEIIKDLSADTNEDISYDLAGQIDFQMSINKKSVDKIFSILEPSIVEYLNTFGKQKFNKNLDFTFYSTSMWLNKQKQFEYNPLHRHGGDLSFVLYLDIPLEIHNESRESQTNRPGSIEFTYGKDFFGQNYRNFLDPRINFEHVPVAGELFIFSSSMYHQVTHFTSDVTRVSLAGNTCFKIIERNI